MQANDNIIALINKGFPRSLSQVRRSEPACSTYIQSVVGHIVVPGCPTGLSRIILWNYGHGSRRVATAARV